MCWLFVSSSLGLREIKPRQRPPAYRLTGFYATPAGLLLTNKQRTHSTNQSCIQSSIHSTIRTYTHPHIHSPNNSFTHPFIHPPSVRPLTHHSFIHSPSKQPFIHPSAHPPSRPHIHSSTLPNNNPSIHPFIHPFTQMQPYSISPDRKIIAPNHRTGSYRNTINTQRLYLTRYDTSAVQNTKLSYTTFCRHCGDLHSGESPVPSNLVSNSRFLLIASSHV